MDRTGAVVSVSHEDDRASALPFPRLDILECGT